MITPSEQIPHEWARVHFAGAELSRVKQVDRVFTIAEAMAQSPGATLPQMFAHPYDLKAAYQFFADPEATPDHLQAGHREGVLLEMEKPGLYLLLEDTSEIHCADKEHPIPGLGPIGASKEAKLGFHLHSVLAVKWPEACDSSTPRRPAVEILGLADQQSLSSIRALALQRRAQGVQQIACALLALGRIVEAVQEGGLLGVDQPRA